MTVYRGRQVTNSFKALVSFKPLIKVTQRYKSFQTVFKRFQAYRNKTRKDVTKFKAFLTVSVGSANLSGFFDARYRTVPYRTVYSTNQNKFGIDLWSPFFEFFWDLLLKLLTVKR